MLDFVSPSYRRGKGGKEIYEIYPKFIIRSSSDLMIRGSDFYAIWDEENNLWSTKEEKALMLIDREVEKFAADFEADHPQAEVINVMHMWDAETGMIDKWHRFVQKQCRDNYVPLDEKLIFSNTETTKADYASKRLNYPLEERETPAWNELIDVLYSPEERHKLEWAIGAVVSGDSKRIQKFIVMYGAPKTGKSTVLNIMQDLFAGYFSIFDSRALGSATNVFALEAFKNNPLVAIQHDGDLSRIEDNTRLNSLVSHELMVVNEKFKSAYTMQFNSFLFMGTNKPVKITDSKSGIIRRLIDVTPTGTRVKRADYDRLMGQIKFELGGIAHHCLQVYEENPKYYDDYMPTSMIGASNDFYNFILFYYDQFKAENGTTLKIAWERYNKYCDDARVPFRYQQRVFKEELKSYFKEFIERDAVDETGARAWNVYRGFITDKFVNVVMDADDKQKTQTDIPKKAVELTEWKPVNWLNLNLTKSLLDDICKDWPAQYANEEEAPVKAWENVTTKLSDILTNKLHYLFFPDDFKHWIVIDFDLKDKEGNKSLELNLQAAAKWPMTYAELSKSGQGIHLHYIYAGDVDKLSRIYKDGIEVKIFTGKSSLRRKLIGCNDYPIATISSGLPLREEKKVINFDGLKNETALRTVIRRSMLKEYPPHATVTSVKFIKKVLDDAHASDMEYDVSDMRPALISFAGKSTHHAQECMALIPQMKFKSEKEITGGFDEYVSDDIVIWDFEVFPNGYLLAYKAVDKPAHVIRNPSASFMEKILQYRLVGHNTRKYDNHIAGGIILGDSIPEVFKRSMRLTSNSGDGYVGSAWNFHYADTLDFPAKKQGLKKWEIELGIHHQELGLKWDQPVPDDMWDLVAEYCLNDVIATETLWKHLQPDFLAREILADISEGSISDTTNALSAKLIFGNEKQPQSQFHYRNLAEPIYELDVDMENFLRKNFPEMMKATHGEAKSLLPYFEGYTFDPYKPKDERSVYKGHFVGEGGFVWAKPGMYTNVITFDVASMHPHSITSEYLFGKYTDIFNDLLEARIAIKHKDYDRARQMFDGKLAKHLTENSNPKALSNALKIVINSVYGLTAQTEKDGYKSPFRDVRNKDNIVAKRGALFMVDLLTEVCSRGGEVIHIKTDSIKVANPTKELQNYILSFGQRYGYTFEIEHKFEKICLVNNAVYIAKCAADDADSPGKWTATGKQFAVPYVFKKLFSKEPIIFDDMCETVNVTSAIYLDMNEGLPSDTLYSTELANREYNAVHEKKKRLNPDFESLSNDDLKQEIAKCHDYQFIGRTGQFTPVKSGCDGGQLVRGDGKKYASTSGATGYRWLESEVLRKEGREADVDESFYISLANDAIDAIEKFGDFEWFSS